MGHGGRAGSERIEEVAPLAPIALLQRNRAYADALSDRTLRFVRTLGFAHKFWMQYVSVTYDYALFAASRNSTRKRSMLFLNVFRELLGPWGQNFSKS